MNTHKPAADVVRIHSMAPGVRRECADPLAGAPLTRTIASSARVTNRLLGGKDNYAADRELVENLLDVVPQLEAAVAETRAFLRRTVDTLARRGVRQFLDIGCGLPVGENVHQITARHDASIRVVYVDHDPIVLAHARALLAYEGNVAAVQGDLREPGRLPADLAARWLLDWDEPVAVLLSSVLHFLTDADRPYEALAELRAALRPGSTLVISHATGDFAPAEAAEAADLFTTGCSEPLVLRSRAEIEPFFGDLVPAAPGLAPLSRWRPGGRIRPPGPSLVYAGIGIRTAR